MLILGRTAFCSHKLLVMHENKSIYTDINNAHTERQRTKVSVQIDIKSISADTFVSEIRLSELLIF